MRSLLARRPARLVLSAVAVTTLAAGAAATTTSAFADSGASRAAGARAGQTCGTNDLTFKLREESQAGGYYLVTAKAKRGITCYLEGIYPSVSFGTAPDTQVSPAEQAVSDSVKLSGSKVAYAGISPKSTSTNHGKEFSRMTLAVYGDETHPVTLKLPSPVLVDEPIATNWHADATDAVPFTS